MSIWRLCLAGEEEGFYRIVFTFFAIACATAAAILEPLLSDSRISKIAVRRMFRQKQEVYVILDVAGSWPEDSH
jgi:hypothetical protein